MYKNQTNKFPISFSYLLNNLMCGMWAVLLNVYPASICCHFLALNWSLGSRTRCVHPSLQTHRIAEFLPLYCLGLGFDGRVSYTSGINKWFEVWELARMLRHAPIIIVILSLVVSTARCRGSFHLMDSPVSVTCANCLHILRESY